MNHNVPVFTLQEVGRQLELSPEMVFQYILDGKLRATKRQRPKGFGHIPESETYRCTQEAIDHFKDWLKSSQQNDPIYSVQAIAHMLNLDPQVVYQHICAGRLKAYKLRGPSVFGLQRRTGAYRCSLAQIEELKALLRECQGKRRYGSHKNVSNTIEAERDAHQLAIAQQLNGMMNNE